MFIKTKLLTADNMASFIISVLFSVMIVSLQTNEAVANSVSLADSSNLFAGDLLSVIVDQKSNENVVYSPVSIHSILTLIYMGAGGNTADELQTVLKWNQGHGKADFAVKYREFFESMHNKSIPEKYYKPPQLSIANGVYVNKDVQVLKQFNEIARNSFKAGVEKVDFNYPTAVIQKINNWVEQKTSNKIKNLLKPDAVNTDTSMVLVNAIHLKGNWSIPFTTDKTDTRDFHLTPNKKVKVDTMLKTAIYRYAELNEYNAKAVELQLRDSDISMLIILPNEIDGLKQVEEKLKGRDLNHIVSNMTEELLNLFLPKFRIESDIDLKEPLKKMGCSSMFGNNANFSNLFVAGLSHQISQVKHKAYLDCKEGGLEAAGASFGKFMFKSAPPTTDMDFAVDHPFIFAIRSKEAVFFAGHVVNL